MDALNRVALTPSSLETILSSCASQSDEEICGLLAGKRQDDLAVIAEVLLVENSLHSLTRFRMEPKGQISAINQIGEMGMELLGIFHSHPNGPIYPSATDLTEWYDDELPSFICACKDGRWTLLAFQKRERQIKKLPIIKIGRVS